MLSAWILGGLFLDSWAHLHQKLALETLLTPWHALFYSGFAACAVFLTAVTVRNARRGYPWRLALPDGYELCLAGVGVFLVGAVLDVFWHLRFGIEKSFEALYSPTHMLVWIGMGLIISGPLRSAWRRPGLPPQNLIAQLPALISMSLLLSLTAAFSQHFNAFYIPWASGQRRPNPELNPIIYGDIVYLEQALGIGSVFVQTAILMGVLLVALRRGLLPVGGVTLVMGLNMLLFNASMLPPALAGGIVGDLLLARLRPSAQRVPEFRAFSLALPLVLYIFYYAWIAATRDGLWWPVHLWVGSIGLAGLTGLLVSYLVLAPAQPDVAR